MTTGWHPGEREVQQRAGVTAQANALLGMFSSEIAPVAAEFLAEQQRIVLGAADANGRVWASLLHGPPGFVRTIAADRVQIAALPGADDPVAGVLGTTDGLAVGGLAIEPATRRRMRLNGTLRRDGDGLLLTTEQVYANCPKYIAGRELIGAAGRVPGAAVSASTLDPEARALLARADTAFVATAAPGAGADVSHRGGRLGFLRPLDEVTLVWPDYAGNNMFQTLGNLAVDPACGLTVTDPDDGTILQLSGRAQVIWDPDRVAAFPSARRLVELRVERVVRRPGADPFAWHLERPARNPPLSA